MSSPTTQQQNQQLQFSPLPQTFEFESTLHPRDGKLTSFCTLILLNATTMTFHIYKPPVEK